MPKVKATRPRRRSAPLDLRRKARWAAPVLLCGIIGGGFLLTRLPFGAALAGRAVDELIAATASLGLVVTDIEVEGRVTTDPATIMAALGAVRGTPILAVNPSRAKEKLEALPWVRSAAIERRLPGTIYVRLVERRPLAVWQHDGKMQLIGRDGSVIPVADLGRFASLPTVVGGDAAGQACALIDMLDTRPDLAARVSAAIRVGGRRWNLRIDRAIDVMLPEGDPIGAWDRLADLERTTALLKRDVQAVDMRLGDRVVIRTSAMPAVPAKDAATAKKPRPVGKNT
jgi:cell division protein FtsQ